MDLNYVEAYARAEDRHWWFVARRRIVAKIISGLSLPQNPTILEVGCGTGGNLAMLQRMGELTAIEPDESARTFADSRGVVTVSEGGLPDDVDVAAASYDLVLSLDVIEHVEDAAGAVRTLAEKLRPGGALIITVPAWQFLWTKHDEVNQHVKRYRPKEVNALLGDVGLHVKRVSCFNSILFPLIMPIRLLQKWTGGGGSEHLAMPSALVNSTLAWIFGLERHLLPTLKLTPGLSVIGVATKPGSDA